MKNILFCLHRCPSGGTGIHGGLQRERECKGSRALPEGSIQTSAAVFGDTHQNAAAAAPATGCRRRAIGPIQVPSVLRESGLVNHMTGGSTAVGMWGGEVLVFYTGRVFLSAPLRRDRLPVGAWLGLEAGWNRSAMHGDIDAFLFGRWRGCLAPLEGHVAVLVLLEYFGCACIPRTASVSSRYLIFVRTCFFCGCRCPLVLSEIAHCGHTKSEAKSKCTSKHFYLPFFRHSVFVAEIHTRAHTHILPSCSSCSHLEVFH